jgi:hypothetical protein
MPGIPCKPEGPGIPWGPGAPCINQFKLKSSRFSLRRTGERELKSVIVTY